MTAGKIAVVGPGEGGKSTLIRVLAERAMNLEVGGRTVGMDHGTLRRGARALSLVGVPGQDRFRVVQEVLLAGARGAVWVHPAGTSPAAGTAELVELLAARGTPYLVYVNQRAETGGGEWGTPEQLPSPGRWWPAISWPRARA